MKLSANARQVLEARYLLRNPQGEIVETPEELFRRVAKAIAQGEAAFSSKTKVRELEEQFFNILSNLEFLPNTPTLMNAGIRLGQMAACFVLPVEDFLKSIFTALKEMALISQSGGGTGFDFSNLRPEGDFVKTTKGVASGPVSFIRIFDTATEVMKQGGKRRGANMGILRANHPDILKFIQAKQKENDLRNFNLSVSLDDAFMKAYEKGSDYPLINPRTGKGEGKLPAWEIFSQIAACSWAYGDPGVLFIDEINRHNPLPTLGPIRATNPCGEQPLLPNESCVLGSINLRAMLKGKEIDWERLRQVTELGVRFLDNVLEVNHYPLTQIAKLSKANRKIGLGIMGLADALITLETPYDSQAAIDTAEQIMQVIGEQALKTSRRLASERGAFPNFSQSIYAKHKPLRNDTLTTIAPTGSISIIANSSRGIEPLFGLAFSRHVLDGETLSEINSQLENALNEQGVTDTNIMQQITLQGHLKQIAGVPEKLKRLFVTSLEISPQWHIKMQAALQKYTHNSVSKTINFPAGAQPKDIQAAYLLAYQLGCKGLTIYRYGSHKEQVLYLGESASCPGRECPY